MAFIKSFVIRQRGVFPSIACKRGDPRGESIHIEIYFFWNHKKILVFLKDMMYIFRAEYLYTVVEL